MWGVGQVLFVATGGSIAVWLIVFVGGIVRAETVAPNVKTMVFQEAGVLETPASKLAYESVRDCVSALSGWSSHSIVTKCGVQAGKMLSQSSFSDQDKASAQKVLIVAVNHGLRGDLSD